MAARKLTQSVIVQAPPGSAESFAVFGPDSEDVPDWAADQIGDHAYEPVPEPTPPVNVSPETVDDEEDEDPDEASRPAAKKTAAKRSSNK